LLTKRSGFSLVPPESCYESPDHTGRLDAVVNDLPVKTEEYYGIAVKKGNTELVEKINNALIQLKEEGKYAELYQKYCSLPVQRRSVKSLTKKAIKERGCLWTFGGSC